LLDAFLKFVDPVLDGESTDSDHTKEIEIFSFDQTILRSAPSSLRSDSSSQARSEHTPFTIIKPLDRTSPKLLQASCAGTLYNKIEISLCQPGGKSSSNADQWKKVVYLKITLEKAFLSRVHLVADPTLHFFGRATQYPVLSPEVLNVGPLEEVDLTYQKIQWLYKGGTGTLNISGEWDLTRNSGT